MNMVKSFVLATAVTFVVGCGGGGGQATGGKGGGGPGGSGLGGSAAGAQGTAGAGGQAGGGTGGVTLVGWVDDLVENQTTATSAPDTVDDKVGIIIDTDDPGAFDPLLSKQTP